MCRSIIDEVGKSKGNETMTRRKKNCFSAGRHWSYSRTITLSIKIRSALACLHGIVIEQNVRLAALLQGHTPHQHVLPHYRSKNNRAVHHRLKPPRLSLKNPLSIRALFQASVTVIKSNIQYRKNGKCA
ncbi:uncharacterized protein LOC143271803 isoform X1 [Peromyscus maniculatus bairdii]|uniref:uncharacterized protein LOC143271803 isoform X1 n=1 Tax=Peromyscus maniculatus bairdii TaxID=230844 RepID=UPI003FD1B6B2